MSVNKLIIAAVFAACLVAIEARPGFDSRGLFRVSAKAGCPTITTKPDFDYRQYAGVWYEIEKIPVVFEDGMTCIRAIYDEIAPNQVSVLNTAVLKDGNLTVINGTAIQPNPDTQPGYLVVSFPGRPDGGYYVLDTDYTVFTAVYDCASIGAFTFEYAWLMSRNTTLTAQDLARARKAYTDQGIDVTIFEATVQGAGCVYAP